MPEAPFNLVATIEATAHDGFTKHGRGLVACLQVGEDIESVIFIPAKDVGELFAAHLKDVEFARWLRTYNVDQEYILMDMIKVNEAEIEAEPHLCQYRKALSA
jgi:hypothetical protein